MIFKMKDFTLLRSESGKYQGYEKYLQGKYWNAEHELRTEYIIRLGVFMWATLLLNLLYI